LVRKGDGKCPSGYESRMVAASIAKFEMTEKKGKLRMVISVAMNIAAYIPRGMPRGEMFSSEVG
tara:strand:+ start:572 stop:763 length:192 start_codon:yes stop_codon:yes gene_type:complete